MAKPKKPEPFLTAPTPAPHPLTEDELAILARWDAAGKEACGLCASWDIDAPMRSQLAYCRRRCTWEFPWSEPCDNFSRRSEQDLTPGDGDRIV